MDNTYDDEWWWDNLRMSKDAYYVLCNELKSHIQRQVTAFRSPISVEARVAICIWRLSTTTECRTVAALFGVGRSSVYDIVNDTCAAIAKHVMHKYVHVPNTDILQEIVNGFESQWGFPQAVGAIDGSHIPIIKPLQSASDYYNRKGYYSILIQGLVDYRGLFMDVIIGWPGKVHDARVFSNSSCFRKGNENVLFPQWSRNINGVSVPLVVLGDSAYPLLPWLMKPYLENDHTTPQERIFNYRQSRARMVVENAFGRLKGKWRCLMKRNDAQLLKNIMHMTAACVTLHNFHEIHDVLNLQEWISSTNEELTDQPHPIMPVHSTAKDIRDAIRDFF